jgi:transposase
MTPTQISEKENIPRSTVVSVLNKFDKTGTTHNKERSGRPRTFTGRDVRNLVRTATKERRTPYKRW